jgi:hypothetical protein
MLAKLSFSGLACTAAFAAVVSIHVDERSDVLEGKPFGSAGAYERIIARADFAVDPTLPANRIISDLELAPKNAAGRVEFSADLYVLKPRDSARGNGTVLFEVPNRGRKGLLQGFNLGSSSLDPRTPAEFGDAFLLERGFTLVWLGWQWDVPRTDGLLRLHAPAVKGLKGLVRAEWVLNKPATDASLSDREHIAYPVADAHGPELQITVRDRADGPRRVIPRAEWTLSSDRTRVNMPAGFQPGKLYELVYTAADPVVVGLGPAAIRDLIAFFKYNTNGTLQLGDQPRHIKRAIAFGTSQSGRFLRTFLYHGFNADEQKRRVFDGVWSHVAGAGRGSFNYRFAQASRDGHPFLNTLYPTDIFPFTDLEQTDPDTGLTGGILTRSQDAGVVPKIFYTNGSYEYWGRAASLIHSSLDGREDAKLPPETRIYVLTGTQHGPGTMPPRRAGTRQLSNPNDYRWIMRGLLVAMQQWLAEGEEPPASAYPMIAKDQLVAPGALQFPKIPGVQVPGRPQRAYRVDYGAEFRTTGVVTLEPPKINKPFPVLVPQVDADGNEVAGVRLPELAVPLGTYTGWNLRDASIGAPDEIYSMVGSWIPFPRTKADRGKDPRRSIEERYKSKEEYLKQVRAEAERLVGERYLIATDVTPIVHRAATVWDHALR